MERCAWKLTSWLELIPEQSALAVCYHYLVTTLSVTHWSIITIWAYVCVRVFVRACVCFHLCIINDKTNITLFLSLPPPPSPLSCPLLTDGCPNLCNGNGQCTMGQQSWHCECQTGWRGPGCSVAMETSCADNKDNEGGEFGWGGV